MSQLKQLLDTEELIQDKLLTVSLLQEELFKHPSHEQQKILGIFNQGLTPAQKIQKVKQLLSKERTLAIEEDIYKNTLIHYAAFWGHEDLVKELIAANKGAADSKNKYGLQALHIAAFKGHQHLVTQLMEGYGDASIIDMNLMYEAQEFYIKKPSQLIRFKIKCTTLGFAILGGQLNIVKQLLQQLQQVNKLNLVDKEIIIDGIGNILHLAVLSRCALILKALVYHDFVNHRVFLYNQFNRHQLTPLSLAVRIHNQIAIHILASHPKVKLNQLTEDRNRSVLHEAVKACNLEAIEVILNLISEGENALFLLNLKDKPKRDKLDRLTAHNLAVAITKNTKIDQKAVKEYKLIAGVLNGHDLASWQKLRKKPSVRRPRIRNLVFQGGGLSGIAFIEAIRVLGKKLSDGDWSLGAIDRVCGSSAGAITAAAVALGYDADATSDKLGSLKLETLLDLDSGKDLTPHIEAIKKATSPEAANSSSYASILWNAFKDVFNVSATDLLFHRQELWNKFRQLEGLCAGKVFLDWFNKEIIVYRLKQDGIDISYPKQEGIEYHNSNIDINKFTFGNLRYLIDKGEPYKHLHLYAFCIESGSEVVMSSEDSQWDDVCIADGVRASISIPGIFKPHEIKDKKYVDGGLLLNMPIKHFDKVKYLNRYLKGDDDYEVFNEETLGFRLVPEKKSTTNLISKINGPADLIHVLFSAFYNAEAIIAAAEDKYRYRCVAIPDCGVGLLDFDLHESKRLELLTAGSQATAEYFGEYDQIIQERQIIEAYDPGSGVLQPTPSIAPEPSKKDEYIKIVEDEDTKIRSLLQSKSKLSVINIYGHRGVGKTSLIKNYLSKDEYISIWIDANSKDKIYHCYWNILKNQNQPLNNRLKINYDNTAVLIANFFQHLTDMQSPSNKKLKKILVYDNLSEDLNINDFIHYEKCNDITIIVISFQKIEIKNSVPCEICCISDATDDRNHILINDTCARSFFTASPAIEEETMEGIISYLTNNKNVGFSPYVLKLFKNYFLKIKSDSKNSNSASKKIKLIKFVRLEKYYDVHKIIEYFFNKCQTKNSSNKFKNTIDVLPYFSSYIPAKDEIELFENLREYGLIKYMVEDKNKYEIHDLFRETLFKKIGKSNLPRIVPSAVIDHIWIKYKNSTNDIDNRYWVIQSAIDLLNEKYYKIEDEHYGLLNAIILHISYWCYGYSLVNIGAMEEAIIKTEKKLRLNPEDKEYQEKYILLLSALSFSLMEDSNFNKALSYFYHALEYIDKKDLQADLIRTDIQRNFAYTLFRAGYYRSALAEIEKCQIDFEKKDISNAINLGIRAIIYHRLGHYEEAERDIITAYNIKVELVGDDNIQHGSNPYNLELAFTKSHYAMCSCSRIVEKAIIELVKSNKDNAKAIMERYHGMLLEDRERIIKATEYFLIHLGKSDYRYLLAKLRFSYITFFLFLLNNNKEAALLDEAIRISDESLKSFHRKFTNNSYFISALLFNSEIRLIKYIFYSCNNKADEMNLLQEIVEAMEHVYTIGTKWYQGRLHEAIKHYRNQQFYEYLMNDNLLENTLKINKSKCKNIKLVLSYINRIQQLGDKIYGNFNHINAWHYYLLEKFHYENEDFSLSNYYHETRIFIREYLNTGFHTTTSNPSAYNGQNSPEETGSHLQKAGSYSEKHITLQNKYHKEGIEDTSDPNLYKKYDFRKKSSKVTFTIAYSESNYQRTLFLTNIINNNCNDPNCYKIWLSGSSEAYFSVSLSQLKQQLELSPSLINSSHYLDDIHKAIPTDKNILLVINSVNDFLIIKDFLLGLLKKSTPKKIMVFLTTGNEFMFDKNLIPNDGHNISIEEIDLTEIMPKPNVEQIKLAINSIDEPLKESLCLIALLDMHAIETKYFSETAITYFIKNKIAILLNNRSYFSITEEVRELIVKNAYGSLKREQYLPTIYNRIIKVIASLYGDYKGNNYFLHIISTELNKLSDAYFPRLRSIFVHIVSIIYNAGINCSTKDKICFLKFIGDYYQKIEYNYPKAAFYKQQMLGSFFSLPPDTIPKNSLKEIISDLARLTCKTGDYMQAIVYYSLSESKKNDEIARAWHQLGFHHRALIILADQADKADKDIAAFNYGIGEFDTAKRKYSAIEASLKAENKEERITLKAHIAMCELHLEEVKSSIDTFSNIINLLENGPRKHLEIILGSKLIDLDEKIRMISNRASVMLAGLHNGIKGITESYEDLFEQQKFALKMAKAVYGRNHLRVAIINSRIARNLCYLKNFSKAAYYAHRSLTIFKNYYSEDHPRALTAHILISDIEFFLGNYLQSYESLLNARKIADRLYDDIAIIFKTRGASYSKEFSYKPEHFEAFRAFPYKNSFSELVKITTRQSEEDARYSFIKKFEEFENEMHKKEADKDKKTSKNNLQTPQKQFLPQNNYNLPSEIMNKAILAFKEKDYFTYVVFTKLHLFTFLKKGILSEKNEKLATLFYELCRIGDIEFIEKSVINLEKESVLQLINTPTKHGWYPIMIACQYGHTKIVKFLLDSLESKPDLKTKMLNICSKKTKYKIGSFRSWDTRSYLCHVDAPLYWAIRNKNKELIQILLDAGADPTEVYNNGYNSISLCLVYSIDDIDSSIAVLKLLLKKISKRKLYALISHEYGRFYRNIFHHIVEKYSLFNTIRILTVLCSLPHLTENEDLDAIAPEVIRRFCKEYDINLFQETRDKRYIFQLAKNENTKKSLFIAMFNQLGLAFSDVKSIKITYQSLKFLFALVAARNLKYEIQDIYDRKIYYINRVARLFAATNFSLENSDVDTIVSLIEKARGHWDNYYFGNPMSYEIVFGGNTDILQKSKVSKNSLNLRNQWTNLMLAAWRNNKKMIKLLIDDNKLNADYINQQNSYGYESALYWAIVNKNAKLVRKLLYHGATVFIETYNMDKKYEKKQNFLTYMPRNGNSFTSLIHIAAKYGSVDGKILEMLLKAAPITSVDFADGRFKSTPLFVSIRNGNFPEAKLLLEHGAIMETRSAHNRNGFDLLLFAPDPFKKQMQSIFSPIPDTQAHLLAKSLASITQTTASAASAATAPKAKTKKSKESANIHDKEITKGGKFPYKK